jgi:argininosuccinate lyase
VHGAIERRLVEALGPLGGKLRAGRSRNDQVVSDLRLWARDACDLLVGAVTGLQEALALQAEAHIDTLAPGYTHLQRGQPIVLAHHLLAYVWMLERDVERLMGARVRADRSVLGSGALAGQTLGLDPAAYATALGMSAVVENSIDAVSSRDFALELLAACAILATTVSRLAEDVVLWSTAEFGFVRLADAFSTGSSIMPQKRNPDVAELARGKAGRVIGALVALLTTVKGLPLAYDRDLQEDKEPVFDAVDTLLTVLAAMAGAIATATFDRERLAAASGGGFSLATDVAEELVRRGVPFRAAHDAVGEVVRQAEAAGVGIEGLSDEALASAHPAMTREVLEALDVRRAVEARDATTGTAPDSVRAQLVAARRAIVGRAARADGRGRTDGVV